MALGDVIKAGRQRKGLSQSELARRVGVKPQAIQAIESGRVQRTRYAAELSRELGVDLSAFGDVLRRDDGNVGEPGAQRLVPVVGFVGAGAEAHFYEEAQGPFDFVPAPDGSTEHTACVEIRGTSLGALFDQWLVFYDEVRRPITSDLVGKLCIVGLEDGRVLIKKVQRSRNAGLFNLISQTEDAIRDVPLRWAARVKSMEPR